MRSRSGRGVINVMAILVVLAGMAINVFGVSAAGSSQDGSTRNEPIALGETATVGDYEVEVVSVTPDADDIVANENQFNDPPMDGNQFYIIRVGVTYTGSDTGNPGIDLDFQAVGDGNVGYSTYENSCGATPDEGYDIGELFEGGSVEYNACWQVASDEADSLVMYVEPLFSFDDEDRVWFALGDEDDSQSAGATPAARSSASSRATARVSETLGESRDEPIPVGEIGEVGDYQVSVVDITPLADDVVASENQFNDPARAGNQFFLVRVAVTYTGSATGNPGIDLNFQAVGDSNVGYTTFENSCGSTPDDEYRVGELFPDGAVEYNVCWQIDSEDADSLDMYVEPLFSFDDDNRIWFSLDDSE